jgi:hypothetical protein
LTDIEAVVRQQVIDNNNTEYVNVIAKKVQHVLVTCDSWTLHWSSFLCKIKAELDGPYELDGVMVEQKYSALVLVAASSDNSEHLGHVYHRRDNNTLILNGLRTSLSNLIHRECLGTAQYNIDEQLISAAAVYARQQGMATIVLESPQTKAATELLDRMGFTKVEAEADFPDYTVQASAIVPTKKSTITLQCPSN